MLSWQPPLVLVHEEKPLSIKRERKAFVYIANASSEIKKKIKVKKRRECLNLLLKKVLRTSPNLALQGTICLLWKWQYDFNNASRCLFSLPFSYYVKEHCNSASVVFIKHFMSLSLKMEFVTRTHSLKANCSIPIFKLGEGLPHVK